MSRLLFGDDIVEEEVLLKNEDYGVREVFRREKY